MTAERENRAPAQRHGPDLATLEARLASKFWREQRKRSLAALALEPGDRALSVGCGLGTTVALMAERVGSAGEAVGVDGSATVIERARSRTDREARIRLEVAGPEALPFEDETFDAVVVEGALQHMGNPGQGLAEIWRVACVGARVVALEPDWDTFVIDGEPLSVTRAFCRRLGERFDSPVVGRELAGMLHGLGAEAVHVETATNVIADHAAAEREYALSDLPAAAVADGSTSAEVAQRWLADLRRREVSGRFLSATTYFLVVARKRAGEARRA
ncbi:MAG: class I SAM-dependent methyltransferase [Thermoleophilaceae bacterium]